MEQPKSTIEHGVSNHRGSLDFTLLLERLEAEILRGEKLSGCLKILGRKDVWVRLHPDKQLQWARLAQMAGDVDTALGVLGYINHQHPKRADAWGERLELLRILDRREELARVIAVAKPHIGREQCAACSGALPGHQDSADRDLDAAAAPFDRLQHRQSIISRFLDLFSGREDCFARQWANKKEYKQGYVPVRRPMDPEDVEEHLSGRKTYGIYLLRSDATVKTAVIDVDVASKFRTGKLSSEEKRLITRERDYLLSRIPELAQEQGLIPVIEFSGGKGFHFWFLFESPIPAGEAKAYLTYMAGPLATDISSFNLEVFPKQDHLTGKGMGNLVKLPLGVHRLTGKRSRFIACHDRSLDAQLDFLMRIQTVKPDGVKSHQREANRKKVVVHPRHQQWAKEWPELHQLETLCPPLGQMIAACRQGKALTQREEKILLQTVGFLARGKTLLHHLFMTSSDYNSHLVDFKISRLRGTPLGCKRIHSLLGFVGDMCRFEAGEEYAHPLLHLKEWEKGPASKVEKADNLQAALENLKLAMAQVQRFMN